MGNQKNNKEKKKKNDDRDYFVFNIADESHEKIGLHEKKDQAGEMIKELTESDEY